MEELKAELERKRKQLQDLVQDKPASKYIKRSDIEKQKQEKYLREQEELQKEKLEKKYKNEQQSLAIKAKQVNATSVGSQEGNQPAASNDEASDLIHLKEEEIIRRLRNRDQPIRLFGETNQQRLVRLRKIESTEERTEGQRNDFKDLLQAADKGLTETLLRGRDSQLDETSNVFNSKHNKTKDAEKAVDTTIISLELVQSDRDTACNLISMYINRVLLAWEESLEARSDDEKQSRQGKLQTVTVAQAGEYLKPFFKSLKKRDLAEDVLARVAEICQFMQQREYMKAYDAYLRLSIGNAPWPIGVTMVGIHERSGREKIFASQIAHALNDETQRKWIQSIKRLMAFAQTKWPPDDVAKLVG